MCGGALTRMEKERLDNLRNCVNLNGEDVREYNYLAQRLERYGYDRLGISSSINYDYTPERKKEWWQD